MRHLGVLLSLSGVLFALRVVTLAVLFGSRAMGLRGGLVMLGRLGVCLLCHFFKLSVGREVPAQAEAAPIVALQSANLVRTKWSGSQARRNFAKVEIRFDQAA